MSIHGRYVLPFAALSEKRKEEFSINAELASVFVLSELERKSGRLNVGKPESSVFILKVGYPLLFAVRENGFAYVFDGLNKVCFDLTCYCTSQIDAMLDDFESSFRVSELYAKFLGRYKSFNHELSSNKTACGGLITDSAFLDELYSYHSEAVEVYSDEGLGFILPVLKVPEMLEIVENIEFLQLDFREKTGKLRLLPDLVAKTTSGFIESFSFESDAVSDEAEAKIRAQKEVINPKIERLTVEYKKQVKSFEDSVDKEVGLLEKQKSGTGKALREREANIERYGKQLKLQAERGNKLSEDTLRRKQKREQQEFDDLKVQFKDIEKQIKKLTEKKEKDLLKLKEEFDKKVHDERKPILALESLRDDKQEGFRYESKRYEELTKLTVDEIDSFLSQQEKLLTYTEPLSLKTNLKVKGNGVIIMHVPFYIAAFSKANMDSKRYMVFSPSLVSSLGFSSKLKGAFGMSKIKSLFDERFKGVSKLGEILQAELSTNPELEAQMEVLMQKNNILDMKTVLTDGLGLLKEEGWLSEEDYQEMLSTLNTEKTP